MSKPFAWSYSTLNRFENCPKQYYHINVKKDVKDEYGDSEAGSEGNAIHTALFKRVTKGVPLPIAYRHFEAVAAKFANTPGDKSGELRLALNRKFLPVAFFADDVYLRAIIDLLIIRGDTAIVVDWKTGKVKPDFTQLAMSAAVLSQSAPEIETFRLAFVWLNYNNISLMTYTRDEIRSQWTTLLPRANKMEDAVKVSEFPMKPSGLCRYCPVRSCPNWEERRR